MHITDKGAQKVLEAIADSVSLMIKSDPILQHHLMLLVEGNQVKEEKPTTWPLVTKVQELYEKYATAEDMPTPAIIGMWAKKVGGEDRLLRLLEMMGKDGILEMPEGYQFKVFNSSVKRGKYQRKKWAKVVGDHVSAGSDNASLEALKERARAAAEGE